MKEATHRDTYPCPLCGDNELAPLLRDATRAYFRCAQCDLISVHPNDRPTRDAESQRYLAHHNDATDAGYVEFLRRLADPICDVVPVGAQGIDVGCGPAPVLGELLSESGRPTVSYDPLFFPDVELLGRQYDFVTCSEVVEHAHDPAALFRHLVGLLRPRGTLGVMTSLYDEATNFKTWWYRRDITHVCFYSERTMRWVGSRFGMRLSFPAANVAIFTTVARAEPLSRPEQPHSERDDA